MLGLYTRYLHDHIPQDLQYCTHPQLPKYYKCHQHLAPKIVKTSLPYFGVKLSCVCLMFAYRKKGMTYSDPMVTYSHPKMTYPKVNYSGLKVS